jgi:tRNA dimethylallyltransferase
LGDWPIVVGGTHYYLHSLLFKDSLIGTSEVNALKADHPILSASDTELFEFLKKVDPVSANRTHPSERRKVKRKVEIFLTTGRPASELFKEQKDNGIECRWDTLIFWLWSNKDVLTKRLDDRVDKMIERGAEEECKGLYELAQKLDAPPTQGIFQAIGTLTPGAWV